MKFNLSIFTNHTVGIRGIPGMKEVTFIPTKIKSQERKTLFTLTSGRCEILNSLLHNMEISKEGNIYWFTYNPNKIGGLVCFTMFDTFGFPVELTKEIVYDYFEQPIDYEGFLICRELQKEKSQGSFKNTDAFN